jgi:biofilm PGA synthesis N-glycosyltransferase PgaC
MICFYLFWTLSYIAILAWCASRWSRGRFDVILRSGFQPCSLLIPLRNEEENIEPLFAEFTKIDHPSLEILLIDDQSEDATWSLIQVGAQTDARVKVLLSPGVGKKAAIEFGVKQAASELILCSDADCRFPADWVSIMTGPFIDPEVQLVCGPVSSTEDASFFDRFQQIEWASILLVTQLFFSIKRPMICSAANMAYRKSAFQAVGGYEQDRHLLSGDDEFLLKRIAAKFGSASCLYLSHVGEPVLTKAQKTFSDLLNQRIRWAGKWKLHQDWRHALAALGTLMAQLIWLGSVVLLGLGAYGALAFILVWVWKIWAESRTLRRILFTMKDISLKDQVATGVLHPFYVILVAAGTLRGKFHWKGRAN